MPGPSPGTPTEGWGLAPSPPRRASPPALRPVVNTSMATRPPDAGTPEEPATKYTAPTLASITESLSLLGLSPETLAMSFGETLADRYLAALRPKPAPAPAVERPALGGCGAPRRTPLADPTHLQLFSSDFIDYLNQIA